MKNIILSLFIITMLVPPVALAQSAMCNTITPTNYEACCDPGTEGDLQMCMDYYDTKISPPPVEPEKKSGTFDPSVIMAAISTANNAPLVGATVSAYASSAVSCLLSDQKTLGSISKKISGATNKLLDKGQKLPVVGKLFSKLVEQKENAKAGENRVIDVQANEKAEKQITKEQCWDAFAVSAKNAALQQMTASTLKWVNTGFDGNPLYVRDIDSYLRTVRNEQLQRLLPELRTSNPIFGNALQKVITKQITGLGSAVSERVCVEYASEDGAAGGSGSANGAGLGGQPKCIRYENNGAGSSMNTPEARAYNDFMSDFSKGGWSAMLNTDNNPLSALFSAANNISNQLGRQAQNTRDEINRNNGFLDMKTCVEYASEDGAAGGSGSANGAGLSGQPKCLKYSTVTPGSVIAGQLGTVLGSSVRQTEMVDEINEVVTGFFRKTFDNLFNPNGLAGLSTGTNGALGGTGLGTNVLLGTNGLPIGTTNPLDRPMYSPGLLGDTDVSRPQMLRKVLLDQKEYFYTSSDAFVAASETFPLLAQLDYYIPGPTPTWKDGLSGNIGSLIDTATYAERNCVQCSGAWDAIITPFTVIDRITGGSRITTDATGVFQHTELAAGDNMVTGISLGASIGSSFPVFGSIIGAAAGAIGGLLFGNKEDVFGHVIKFSQGGTTNRSIIDYFSSVGTALIKEIDSRYNIDTISAAYGTIGATQEQRDINKANAITAYRLTADLIPYSSDITELETEYRAASERLQQDISTLETIQTEALKIVKTAKARYIAERAAAGNPVVMSCIDRAYVIDETTVPSPRRKEAIVPSNNVRLLDAANDYFYKSL